MPSPPFSGGACERSTAALRPAPRCGATRRRSLTSRDSKSGRPRSRRTSMAPPEFFARGKDAAQLVAVSERLHKLPVAQGTLKPAAGRLGEQCHRAATLCHRVILVDVVCEVEVLEEKACLFLAS